MQIEGGSAGMEEASLFRSQRMDYVRMVFPKEAAHRAVSMFGHIGKVQFSYAPRLVAPLPSPLPPPRPPLPLSWWAEALT